MKHSEGIREIDLMEIELVSGGHNDGGCNGSGCGSDPDSDSGHGGDDPSCIRFQGDGCPP